MLVSPEGRPLLTNFELSSYVVNSSLKLSHPPTAEDNSMRWMAPERFETAEPTTEGDVWAFGMITLVRCQLELFMKFDIRDLLIRNYLVAKYHSMNSSITQMFSNASYKDKRLTAPVWMTRSPA